MVVGGWEGLTATLATTAAASPPVCHRGAHDDGEEYRLGGQDFSIVVKHLRVRLLTVKARIAPAAMLTPASPFLGRSLRPSVAMVVVVVVVVATVVLTTVLSSLYPGKKARLTI